MFKRIRAAYHSEDVKAHTQRVTDSIESHARSVKGFVVKHRAVLGVTTLVAAGAVGVCAAVGGAKMALQATAAVAAMVAVDLVVGVAANVITRKEDGAQPFHPGTEGTHAQPQAT